MLIEAALSLPKWLKPEISDTRVCLHNILYHEVFIYRGAVHIIPLPRTPAELATIPTTPQIPKSLEIIRTAMVNTQADHAIQEVIHQRIKE